MSWRRVRFAGLTPLSQREIVRHPDLDTCMTVTARQTAQDLIKSESALVTSGLDAMVEVLRLNFPGICGSMQCSVPPLCDLKRCHALFPVTKLAHETR